MFKNIKLKFHSFKYNFGWEKWVTYIDGWLPKLALSVPIIGYLILFNDTIGPMFSFGYITENISYEGLSGSQRLRYVYFGLISLGVSNALYLWRRPPSFKYCNNLEDYSRICLETLTLTDYEEMHRSIQSKTSKTPAGKYPSSEWSIFVDDASVNPIKEGMLTPQKPDWENAKSRNGNLLRSMLEESWARINTSRIYALSTCLFFSTLGYALLLIPGVDLFLKVSISSFS